MLAAGGEGTETYQIKVRVNNYCVMRDGKVHYPWDGGPEGYSDGTDNPANMSTQSAMHGNGPADGMAIGGFLGDNLDSGRDVDWIKLVDLTEGYEYTLEVWTSDAYEEKHQATQLKILGIYIDDNTFIDGTASPDSGKYVSILFRPDTTRDYYIAVGSEGDDETGVYRTSIVSRMPVTNSTGNGNGGNNNNKSNTGDPAAKENSPPAGLPIIGGLAQVGGALTVNTSGISDPDGLQDIEFSYQWIANDGQGDSHINGETGSNYAPVESDVGNTIMVLVSFTDNKGNPEQLTSTPTSPVAEEPDDTEQEEPVEPPPAPKNLSVAVNADGSLTLTWAAPDDDSVSGYQILRRRPTMGEDTLLIYVENTGSANTAFTDTSVTAGIQHVYRVKAISEGGAGRRSNFARATP